MDPLLIGWIFLIVMFVLMFAGLPIAFATFVVGFFGIVVVLGSDAAFGAIRIFLFGFVASFNWALIPFFVFMGVLLFESGLSDKFFDALAAWLGHLPGGLAMATTASCAAMGTCTGSSTAASAIMAKMAYPQMRRYGYDKGLAIAVIAATASLAAVIPPSIPLVVYAMLAEVSVAKELIAGILPGIVSAIVYMIVIGVICKRNPRLGPPQPPKPWRERFIALRLLTPVVVMFLVICGGIMAGVFTASEAGGIGSLVAIIIVLVSRRFKWSMLKRALLETARFSSMIMLLITGFTILAQFMTYVGLTTSIANYALIIPNPLITLIVMIIIYVFMGMFIGVAGVLFIVTPIFIPTVIGLGYDPIWFGLIVLKLIELALITPPVSENVFVAVGIVKDVSVPVVYRALIWFYVCDFITLALYIAFPQIILFIPNLVLGG